MSERAPLLKIVVIGGGSVYTPELIEGFLLRYKELPVEEICLMDINYERLQIVGKFAERMIKAAKAPIRIKLTMSLEEALMGATFVISQIRVGGMAARILDEKIPLRFNVIGQETIGPGGFAKALRTIPVMLDIAKKMEELCPNAFLINFTNPSGIITEVILSHTRVRAVGLCNIPLGMTRMIANWLGVDSQSVELDYIGLNHLSWVRGVKIGGEDVYDRAFAVALEQARRGAFPFSPALLETLGLIPSYYLRYYYHHDEVLAEQKHALKTRGEEVQAIDKELFALYADPSLTQKPALLEKRGGAHYSTAAVALISAIYNNKSEIHIVNVQNKSAVPDLPHSAVVEVPARINQDGAHPLPTACLPRQVRGLVQAVKAFEELTIEAAVTGSKRAALQALLAHPLVPSFSVAQGLWREIKKAHIHFLPQFH